MVIHKFMIPSSPGIFYFTIDEKAEILTADIQRADNVLWAKVSGIVSEPKASRKFYLFETGQHFDVPTGVELKYIATIKMDGGNYILHLFEAIIKIRQGG